jgi:signal transduction histidine kinase
MRTVAAYLAAGGPLGLTAAVLIAGFRRRSARRRAALNSALHELRRPLQVLALAPRPREPARAPEAADLALAALEDLDREINGSHRVLARRPVACRGLVESTLERWRRPAADARRSLELRWWAGAAMVMVDPCRIAQALDNLLANALEHGGLRVWVEAAVSAGVVRISVCNTTGRRPAQRRAGRNRRRGHGLRVVASIATAHGGRFEVQDADGVWMATLELPPARLPVPSAAVAGGGASARERLAAAG